VSDRCPVCGCTEYAADNPWFACEGCSDGSDCRNGPQIAIERAAEIERLKAALAKSVELWPAALARADEYETQRDELADQVAALMEENARLKEAK